MMISKNQIKIKNLGKARKVRVTQADTFISGPEGSPEKIKERIMEIKRSISESNNERSHMILKVFI